MRVLYDISTLGLAHFYQQSRGGACRVDLNITQGLLASRECELLFCANHSTVAHHGCAAFLSGHAGLGAVPLLAERTSATQSAVRAIAAAAHGSLRRVIGRNVLPSGIRHVAGVVDRRLHRPVGDAAAAIDVFHGSTAAPLPSRNGRSAPRRFLTIYDLAPISLPAFYSAPYRRSLTAAIASVGPEDHVITNSAFVRDEVLAAGIVSADRLHVVPLAADPALFHRCDDVERIAAVRDRYGIGDGGYVLAVTNPDVRKNVPHAIHAFARAAHQERDALVSLVLAGSNGPGADRIDEAIGRYPALRGRIIRTGHVPDADLAPLYSGARIFVYPSIYEGFGLPPLEAMQCGAAVIASNTSALPEVAGDGAVLVPPDDVDALADAMLDLARDTDRRAALQQRALQRAGGFSWERSTAATLSAYRAALHG